ncbi:MULTISPECIES: hypothetical protein [Pseudomonas]|nr:hypothetical protein [Pseudomonas guariconensis]
MSTMHNPTIKPVDNSPVDNKAFAPQVVRIISTTKARLTDKVMIL